MKGEPLVEKDDIRNPKLSYKRDDGKIFDLKDCATGIKSFSILQLLLKNGFLQKTHCLLLMSRKLIYILNGLWNMRG